MKIDGPRAPRPAGRKGVAGAKASGGAFSKLLQDGNAVAATSAAKPVAAVDSLLSVQASEADQNRGGAGAARARNMLDRLEDLRHGLLLGIVPGDRLADLAVMARARQDEFTDPALQEILRDIELRARVELAKLDRGR